MFDSLVHRMPRVRRSPGVSGWKSLVSKSLEVNVGVVSPVHSKKESPLLFRSSLGDHTTHRVTLNARAFRIVIGFVIVIEHAALYFEEPGT